MKKLSAFIVGGLVSASAWSQGYTYQESEFAFDTIVSVATGKADLEHSDGNQDMHSVSVALDFHRLPVEVELSYYNLQDSYHYQSFENDVLVEDEKYDGTIDNWGVSGKLDLSWDCRAACAYLIAGYNLADLSADAYYNGDRLYSYSTDASYAHWGAGFRYDFSPHLRASIEYLQYDIGKQKLDGSDGLAIDFGKANAWQAGVGYRF
ncbi:outer membrane protein [Microbulbifer pacificus]|uniref:Outer membrane beta-barrel protein n=1 Tax=Microbulbifer pacificus TaxID=407164 RepID=A0AAU0MYA9_9GAMM|nr:outer membrane beta-barrel protein [Microbulbifer pacificus]WOX04814.1 outer membrane beta-barrel protein [Microbulbifer pacificus]